jgi:CubicO group peptidase (beta-lactamase class C family)
MAEWEVPGLAIGVVQEGKLVHAQGYGVCDLGARTRVDTETVFSIASCTKGFTAAAIAKLVDDEKLQWDDPIVNHLPAFRLSTPEHTATITIRHALAHRTGLPTANMLWRSGAFGSDDILSRLRWLRPIAAPGERFLYNNNIYLVLGKVVEQISGQRWIDFLRTELFEPLGMKSTVADSTGLRGLDNAAVPHASDDGKVCRIEPYCPNTIAPAGAIHSSVLDMAAWLRLHLDGGLSNGQRVLSAARIAEMHTPPARTEDQTAPRQGIPRAPISEYGLGWFFNDFAGRKVVEHSGTQNGYVAWVAMIPEERLGLVILANQHATGLNSALRSWIFDACLGRPERDWSAIVRADYTNGYQRLLREAKSQFDANRPPPTPPLRPLAEYAGQYESKLYGRLRVTATDDGLQIEFGTRFEGKLEHWKEHDFRAFFRNPRLDDWLVKFTLTAGEVAGLRVKESPWAPAWFDDADDLGEFLRG